MADLRYWIMKSGGATFVWDSKKEQMWKITECAEKVEGDLIGLSKFALRAEL